MHSTDFKKCLKHPRICNANIKRKEVFWQTLTTQTSEKQFLGYG